MSKKDKLNKHKEIIDNHAKLTTKILDEIRQLTKEKNRTDGLLGQLLRKQKKQLHIQKANEIHQSKCDSYKLKSLESHFLNTSNTLLRLEIFESMYELIDYYKGIRSENFQFNRIYNILNKLIKPNKNKKYSYFTGLEELFNENIKLEKKYFYSLFIITGNLIIKEYFSLVNKRSIERAELLNYQNLVSRIAQQRYLKECEVKDTESEEGDYKECFSKESYLKGCFKGTFLYDLF